MADTVVELNNNYAEREKGSSLRLVTNNLGRTAAYKELVYLGGLFGSVEEFNGIANGASGYIDIAADREISTTQVATGATFTAGNTLLFEGGGAGAEGTLTSIATATTVPVGKITGEFGTGAAQTGVKFIPFVQNLGITTDQLVDAQAETLVVKTKTIKVTCAADSTYTSVPLVLPIPVGSTIKDITAICTGAVTDGTVVVKNGSTAICTALVMAVDKTINRMSAAVDDSKLVVAADPITLVTHADGDLGIVYIDYI